MVDQNSSLVSLQLCLSTVRIKDFSAVENCENLKKLALAIMKLIGVNPEQKEVKLSGGQVGGLKGVNFYAVTMPQITFLLDSSEKKMTVMVMYHQRYESGSINTAIRELFPDAKSEKGNDLIYTT